MRTGHIRSRVLPTTVLLLALGGCGGTAAGSSAPTASSEPSTVVPGGGDAGSPGGSSPTSGESGSSQASNTPDEPEPDDAHAESLTPTRDGQQGAVLDRVPGSASQACRTARASDRDLRVGSFVVGPIETAVKSYGKAQPGSTPRTVRLYWVPRTTQPMKGLTLNLRNLGTGATMTVRQSQVADAEQWKFYDTQIELKQSGAWQIEATSGPDRGCVTITLPRA